MQSLLLKAGIAIGIFIVSTLSIRQSWLWAAFENDIIVDMVAEMNPQKLPSFWTFLWISLVLTIIGWGGLIILIFMTLPTIGPRWLFFFLFTLAISGTALPVAYFLNRRSAGESAVEEIHHRQRRSTKSQGEQEKE